MGQNHAPVGSVSMAEWISTGSAVLHLVLHLYGCEATRLAHGRLDSVHNGRFHYNHFRGCGQVEDERCCDLHEMSLLVISF